MREVRHSRWLAVCSGLKQVFLPIFCNHHQPPLPQTPPLAPWSLLSLALSSTSPPLSTLFLKNTNMVSASVTWNYRGWCLWCPCSPYGNSGSQLSLSAPAPVYFTSTSGFPHSSVSKESACKTKDLGSIPVLGRCPGEGNGNPLQYSCLENHMGRGAWLATVHGVSRVRHDLATKPPHHT